MVTRKFWGAVTWCFLAVLIGLMQLWCVLGYVALAENKVFEYDKFVLDCSLVFFSTALVASLAVDFFSQNRKRVRSLGLIGVMFGLYPAVVVGLGILIYSVCFFGQAKVSIVSNVELVMFTMSVVYALIVKCVDFVGTR